MNYLRHENKIIDLSEGAPSNCEYNKDVHKIIGVYKLNYTQELTDIGKVLFKKNLLYILYLHIWISNDVTMLDVHTLKFFLGISSLFVWIMLKQLETNFGIGRTN